MANLQGIIPALMTPFDADGALDEEGLRALTDYVIQKGSDALYVNGSTSESFLCEVSVRERILRTVAEANGNRVPLVAQVGSLVYEESRRLVDVAAESGYSYISAVTPFYYKFSFDEVISYYRKLIHPDMPLIIYFIPALTGLSLDMEQISRLFDLDNVAGIKFTSGDIFLLERLRKQYAEKVLMFGYDEMMFSGAFLGADGFIGSTYNVTAPLAKNIWNAVRDGRNEEARRIQGELNDFISTGLEAGLYPFIKEVLTRLGIPAGVCRHPFAPLDEKWKPAAEEWSRKLS